MEPFLSDILSHFQLDTPAVSCSRFGHGHINETYLVQSQSGHRYILQRVSVRAFPDFEGLMGNITAVTAHLHAKSSDPDSALTLIAATDGKNYYQPLPGSNWRVYDYIENSLCLQSPETPEDFYQSAIAFGTFQQLLSDFPAHSLCETIRNFHNTPDRYRIFREVLERDPLGRAKDVQPEIEFTLAREEEAGTLIRMLEAGQLPLRVTHNDTKLNNVLFRASTRRPLCIIDLDTTMPGLSAYDFGDSIRFGAATAAEDEKDLTKMEMDLSLYRIFTRGFLAACPGLTENERKMLPMGAKLMTMECGIRFLTDYLDGDHYFGISRPEHNLDRCRTQYKLVADMEAKWEQMERIVEEEYR